MLNSKNKLKGLFIIIIIYYEIKFVVTNLIISNGLKQKKTKIGEFFATKRSFLVSKG